MLGKCLGICCGAHKASKVDGNGHLRLQVVDKRCCLQGVHGVGASNRHEGDIACYLGVFRTLIGVSCNVVPDAVERYHIPQPAIGLRVFAQATGVGVVSGALPRW